MERADSDLQALLGPGASIRRLMGVWWSQGRCGRICSAASASVTLSSFVWLSTFTGLKLVLDPPQQLEDIALCCFVIVLCSGFLAKVVFFIYKSDALRELLQLLSDARRNYGDGKSSRSIRRRYQKLSRRLYLCMQVAVLQGLAAWVSTPVLVRVFLSSDHNSLESARQFPVPLWFPGNMYSSPTYEILYILQAFSQLAATQSSLCVDAFFIHMILLVAAELEVLNENISTMQKIHLSFQETEYQEHWTITKYKERTIENGYLHTTAYLSSEDFSGEMYLQLVNNIQHHHVILRSVSLLQRVMTISIFILLFVNMADLCSCIFVTAVSEKLVDSAVSCGWADCDARFKRSLLVFMTVAAKPLDITVGKLCKLSKQMLLQVLNGTYGLLNLLLSFS
ncbi:uncharacterized protein LOC126199619 [Schistocerca nitens]|uniref:uncharacterized protein LOC126199619 n=1 Tax=Schistocerca nitens TaxID=7011 RepID=UPI0021187DB5|nr:uncharacterized protein LOC126199619 [Schistocerca nitens]